MAMSVHPTAVEAREGVHLPGWVRGAALGLLAIAMLGAAFLVGRATDSTDAAFGLADEHVVQLVDDGIAMWNAKDVTAIASHYTDDAVVFDIASGSESRGIDEISAAITAYPGQDWNIVRTSDVVRQGDFVSSTYTYNGGSGVAVWQFDGDLISRGWLIGN